MKFWRQFPALTLFQYQCSPQSTALAISKQFDVACRFQKHAKDQIAVLLLDEIGLAEFSPTNALKVLHRILVKPPISIVGISNWRLDRSKMNRGILLSRPNQTIADLRYTGSCIFENSGQTPKYLSALVSAFYSLYNNQEKQFYGLRDLYSLIKSLRLIKEEDIDKQTLIFMICRHLGGKKAEVCKILGIFNEMFEDY